MSIRQLPESESLAADARTLIGMMNETTHVRLAWSDQDYGPMLDHQLDASLSGDLSQLFSNVEESLPETPIRTFRELLAHPHPPVEILRLVKDFAGQLHRNARLAYPEDLATVLYYSSIAAADLRARTTITELPRDEILKGYRWARDREWIPPDIRQLFDEALEVAG